jgi:hypothetical protein
MGTGERAKSVKEEEEVLLKSMWKEAFWDVTSCSLVGRYLHLGGSCFLYFEEEGEAARANHSTDTGREEKETGLGSKPMGDI